MEALLQMSWRFFSSVLSNACAPEGPPVRRHFPVKAFSWRLAGLLILLLPTIATADLARRTYLGLQFDLGNRDGPGLLVESVLPGSTAEAAGMRPGDRLTSVGGVQVLDDIDELRAELRRTTAGERIGLRWYRGSNRVMRVRPPLLTLPAEEMPGSLVRYDSVNLDGIRQRLILSEPVASEATGLVFYLSGLGCASHDYWFETDSPIKQLLDGWAAAGFATARLEKRGAGDSEGPDCSLLSFEDERRGYAAAIEHLAERGFRGRIFLFGHSLGGVIAPLVVTDAVAGVMVYGTVSKPWFDYMMENFERQDRLAGLAEDQIAARQALRKAFQQGLLFAGETPAELIARIPDSEGLPDVQLASEELYFDRSVKFFTELAALDPARAWRQVWQDVLALHGGYDWVSGRADHEEIARLTGGKFQSLPGMDHAFLGYESLEESFTARGTGHFDEEIIRATLAWMATQVAASPAGADS
jgi:pimeloyl-ACP methyl ester carboxylesterase